MWKYQVHFPLLSFVLVSLNIYVLMHAFIKVNTYVLNFQPSLMAFIKVKPYVLKFQPSLMYVKLKKIRTNLSKITLFPFLFNSALVPSVFCVSVSNYICVNVQKMSLAFIKVNNYDLNF